MTNGETKVEERLRGVERTCAARLAEYNGLIESAEDHEKRMRDIEKLLPALRAVMWAGSVLAASMILYDPLR